VCVCVCVYTTHNFRFKKLHSISTPFSWFKNMYTPSTRYCVCVCVGSWSSLHFVLWLFFFSSLIWFNFCSITFISIWIYNLHTNNIMWQTKCKEAVKGKNNLEAVSGRFVMTSVNQQRLTAARCMQSHRGAPCVCVCVGEGGRSLKDWRPISLKPWPCLGKWTSDEIGVSEWDMGEGIYIYIYTYIYSVCVCVCVCFKFLLSHPLLYKYNRFVKFLCAKHPTAVAD